MMKRPLPVFLLACSLVGCAAEEDRLRGDTWQETRQRGTGEVVVHYVPAEGFAYETEDGRLTGVTIDILHAMFDWIEQEYDVTLTRRFVAEDDWRAFYDRVREAEGGVFGAGNVTITEERRSELHFSPSYLTNVAVLITDDAVPQLASLEEMGDVFAGLDALAFEGTLHEARLKDLRRQYLPGTAVTYAHSNQEIIDRVREGGYFAYVDVYNYWRAKEGGAPLRRHGAGDEPSEEFGIIMPLENDWTRVVEAFFGPDDAFRNSPQYRRALEIHLGEQLTDLLEAARQEQANRN